MGGFSSFAISFSLISVLTGIFANFNFGFREVGVWIVASWLLVAAGQYVIARVMAGLSVRFPIAGYGYQWTARLVNPHFGFFIGWVLLAQFLTGFPGIAQTAVVTIAGSFGWAWSGNTVVLVTLAVITAVTVLHLRGIRAAAAVNNAGVYAELSGVAIIIVLLTWAGLNNERPEVAVTASAVPAFSSFAHSLLLGAWCLTGFEAAADLAEETRSPEATVPKAVVRSLVGAALAGALMLVLLIWCAGDLRAAQGQPDALQFILSSALGSRMTSVVMVFVVISIFACAVASMATASRLLFSMARDRMLPFSNGLAKVNVNTQTPQAATLVVWGFSCLAVVLFRRVEVITAVSALATFIGYAGIMYACVKDRLSVWSLTGLVWTFLVIAALALPETEIPGVAMRHLPAVSAGVVIMIAVIVYFVRVRPAILSGKAGPPPTKKSF